MSKGENTKSEKPNISSGFKAPTFFRGNQFGKNIRPGNASKFNPGTFKTQHKG